LKINQEVNKELLCIIEFSINNFNKFSFYEEILIYENLSKEGFEFIDETNYEDYYNSLNEIIEYNYLSENLLKMYFSFNQSIRSEPYGTYWINGVKKSLSRSIDFSNFYSFFSFDNLLQLIVLNELIHKYDLVDEFLDFSSTLDDIHNNIFNSIIFLVKNYDVFSLKFLKFVKKDQTYKNFQIDKTYSFLGLLVGNNYLDSMQELSKNPRNNQALQSIEEYNNKLYQQGYWYDLCFITDIIDTVGISNKLFENLFIAYLEEGISFGDHSINFPTTKSLFKIFGLILRSENSFKKYVKVIINYILSYSSNKSDEEKSFYLSKDKDMKKYLIYSLKFSIQYGLNTDLNNLLIIARKVFSLSDTEYIDFLLDNVEKKNVINIKELQYIYKSLLAYIDLSIDLISDFNFDDEFDEIIIDRIKRNADVLLDIYKYYSKNIKGYVDATTINNEVNDIKAFNFNVLKTSELVGVLILLKDLVERYIGWRFEKYTYSIYYSKLSGIDYPESFLILYRKINAEFDIIDKIFGLSSEGKYEELFDNIFDNGKDLIEKRLGYMSMLQIINLYRVNRCYTYINDVEKVIMDKKPTIKEKSR
jgi:hypothetical protein